MSTPLRTLLGRKGWGAISVKPGATVVDVADVLTANHIGAVAVLDSSGALLGLVSERDIVRSVSEHEDITDLTAAEIMVRNVPVLNGDATVYQAMQIMTVQRQRHIPICEEGRLVGMISIGDVVKNRIEEQELAVEEMRAYVMQTDPDHDPASGRYAVS